MMRPKRTQPGTRRIAPFLGKRAPAAEAVRLSRALQAGSGHIAVIGAYRATACAQVRAALVDVETVGVVYLSTQNVEPPPSSGANLSHPDVKPPPALQRVRGLMARLIEHARAVGKPAYVVVEDADAEDAAALERMRMAVECAPDAIKWLRMVLVGGERLEEILNEPSASALSSRVGARVRVPSGAITSSSPTSSERSPVATYVVAAAIAVALVSITVWSYAPDDDTRDVAGSVVADSAPPSGPSAEQRALAQAAPKKAAEVEIARATAPAETPAQSEVERSAAPAVTPAETQVPRLVTPVEKPAETQVARPTIQGEKPAEIDVAAASGEQTAKSEESAPARKPQVATKTVASVPPVSNPSKAAVAPTRADARAAAPAPTKQPTAPTAAPKSVTVEKPKTAALRSTVATQEEQVATRKQVASEQSKRAPQPAPAQADRESAAAPTDDPELEAAAATRQVMIEAGSFKEADRAHAARRALEETFDHVLVVRLDPVDGATHYSVRVVGLGAREIWAAESELRRLGYSPTRHETPGVLARFGRRGRAFLAGLF